MTYKIEEKETEISVSFEIPWEELEKDFNKLVKDASKNVSVKGFRKGHVPEDVAIAQVDKASILSQVVNEKLTKEYNEIVKEGKYKLIGSPEVQIKKIAEGNTVEVDLTISLMPEVELPKDWKKIVKKVNKENEKENVAVSDEDVDAELKKLAESRAQLKEVDRKAKKGDSVKIDFVVKKDGVVIEGGTSKNHAIVLGSGTFIPGFEDNVIGMKKGEEKSFELEFPKEYHAKHLAGAKATFDVTLNVIEERIVPEIDDEFAKSLGKDIKDLKNLKENLKEGMQKEKEGQFTEKKRTSILEALIEKTQTKIPKNMIKEELDVMTSEMEQQVQMSGMTLDDFLEKSGKTRADLEKDWTPQAQKRIIGSLIMTKLSEELEVKVDSEEIEEEMNKVLAKYRGVEDMEKNIDTQQLYNYTKMTLTNKKTFEEIINF